MALLRRIGLFVAGAYAGVVAAAAFVRRALPSRGDAASDEVALVAIFDGVKLTSRASAFRGGSMLAWFGGIAVDLRGAELAPDARLTLHCIFGGIAIRVPEGVRVESNLKALAGGVDVRTPGPEDPAGPTLVVDGLAVLGGIAVGARVSDYSFES